MRHKLKTKDMKLSEIEQTLNAYDKHLRKAPSTHEAAIGVLKLQLKTYKKAKARVDKFESPNTYKTYADFVTDLTATINTLENL